MMESQTQNKPDIEGGSVGFWGLDFGVVIQLKLRCLGFRDHNVYFLYIVIVGLSNCGSSIKALNTNPVHGKSC